MKHVLNCSGDEVMVSRQFPSLKAVKIKVVLSLDVVLGK